MDMAPGLFGPEDVVHNPFDAEAIAQPAGQPPQVPPQAPAVPAQAGVPVHVPPPPPRRHGDHIVVAVHVDDVGVAVETLPDDLQAATLKSTADVRPGDVVETSYTIIGGNPILRGKHAAWIAFEWGQAMMETRHRLRTRADRPIHFRGVNGAPAPERNSNTPSMAPLRWPTIRSSAALPNSAA